VPSNKNSLPQTQFGLLFRLTSRRGARTAWKMQKATADRNYDPRKSWVVFAAKPGWTTNTRGKFTRRAAREWFVHSALIKLRGGIQLFWLLG
jgi:hypothetical protein